MSSDLMIHTGARLIDRSSLATIDAPPATQTWFPVKHSTVLDAVGTALETAGFAIRSEKVAVARDDHRMFATFDLASSLADGVSLSVGVRNSTDKSLPLGFVAGNRVFVCDNLAFRSELLVARKHTRHGEERFGEAILRAVGGIAQFQVAEATRIETFKVTWMSDRAAESLILRAFESGIVSSRNLAEIVQEWREPTYSDFQPRTLWSLFNGFTTVLGSREEKNPQQYAAMTMRLQALCGKEVELANAI